jgi:hypothetical protein
MLPESNWIKNIHKTLPMKNIVNEATNSAVPDISWALGQI